MTHLEGTCLGANLTWVAESQACKAESCVTPKDQETAEEQAYAQSTQVCCLLNMMLSHLKAIVHEWC